MKFSFHPEAEEELNKTIDYYEDIESGLGYDFALEVHSTRDFMESCIIIPEISRLIPGVLFMK